MHSRLLSYYDRELAHLRELGGEFARDFPAVASELGLGPSACADPHVERLLEGFAFLTARVQLQIDAEFPRFSEQMLNLIYPQCLAPTPSMAIVSLAPDPRQTLPDEGWRVQRGTPLAAQLPHASGATCRFRTGHDVELWPIEVSHVQQRPLAGEELRGVRLPRGQSARSALRIGLRSIDGRPLARLALDRLPLFLGGQDAQGRRLYELCASGTVGLLVRDSDGRVCSVQDRSALSADGFHDDQALLPYGPRAFQGHRLLQEYFALPDRFAFLTLTGIEAGIRRCTGTRAEIVLLLDRHDAAFESLSPAQVRLFCTPIVNLFEQRTDRVQLSDREHEYRVVADRTRPEQLEVHSVIDVVGRGATGPRTFRPLYACSDRTIDEDSAHYTVHRRARTGATGRASGQPLGGYVGSETFLSLVDGAAGPYRASLDQLTVTAWCTNAALPLRLANVPDSAWTLETAAPIRGVELVRRPSVPRDSQAWGDVSWRLIAQLSCNYLGLLGEQDGAGALRRLLELHADRTHPATRRLLAGLRAVDSSSIVRRLPQPGPACFARGVEIMLTVDEAAFEGVSSALFGRVLSEFLARSSAINSFVELALRTSERGELIRFPPRLGREGSP
jgi:type VI secretion system protein ImpG